jgi:hypothetical protein
MSRLFEFNRVNLSCIKIHKSQSKYGQKGNQIKLKGAVEIKGSKFKFSYTFNMLHGYNTHTMVDIFASTNFATF